ncbi:DNA polymerase IV [Candidatus Micrarchaeota archaeon]|nr:DNA polymerase IV [Candidatus Micrarchaeota archaeon]MBU1886596.1 DNA polymerase IV [Candidatus Micrarchaeota archaeon]
MQNKIKTVAQISYVYLHIDMDYFYAQLEEKRHPESLGKVIAVCMFSGRTEISGAITTVNYLGRKIGIKAGMPIISAKKLAPDGVFIHADREYYAEMSARIDMIIRANCEKVVQASIDEWNAFDPNAAEIGPKIKQVIQNEMDLICTLGVAPSVLGAKMAASKAKPNGLLILDTEHESKMINESIVEAVPGIGKKTTEALGMIGVKKVSDLKKTDPILLVETFGKKTGTWLHDLALGRYGAELGEEKEQEGISRIGTLKQQSRDIEFIMQKISELEDDAKKWLFETKKSYKTLALIFITDDMALHTKSFTFRNPLPWNEDITKEKRQLLEEFLKQNSLEIRRIGIKFGNFMDLNGQTTLF